MADASTLRRLTVTEEAVARALATYAVFAGREALGAAVEAAQPVPETYVHMRCVPVSGIDDPEMLPTLRRQVWQHLSTKAYDAGMILMEHPTETASGPASRRCYTFTAPARRVER